MEVEFKDFQKNIEKFSELGTKITVHIVKDGKPVMDLVPRKTEENEQIRALHKFAGSVPDTGESYESLKDERLDC